MSILQLHEEDIKLLSRTPQSAPWVLEAIAWACIRSNDIGRSDIDNVLDGIVPLGALKLLLREAMAKSAVSQDIYLRMREVIFTEARGERIWSSVLVALFLYDRRTTPQDCMELLALHRKVIASQMRRSNIELDFLFAPIGIGDALAIVKGGVTSESDVRSIWDCGWLKKEIFARFVVKEWQIVPWLWRGRRLELCGSKDMHPVVWSELITDMAKDENVDYDELAVALIAVSEAPPAPIGKDLVARVLANCGTEQRRQLFGAVGRLTGAGAMGQNGVDKGDCPDALPGRRA